MFHWTYLLQALLVPVGIVVARAALTTARTPQGAAAWVVFLVAFPLVAIPAYAVFGSLTRANVRSSPDPVRPAGDEVPAEVGRLAPILTVAETPLTRGNRCDLLIDGAATFDAIFDAIDEAETEVLVQFYILRNDALGRKLKDRLIAAAGRGCRVMVLVDAIGSLFLGRTYRRELREAGIEFQGIRGPQGGWMRIGINFRNHRKVVICDTTVGFTGGINAGQEYIDGGGFSSWRDTFVRIAGPSVAEMRRRFAGDWRAITNEELPDMPDPGPAGTSDVLPVSFGPTDPLEKGSLLLCGLVGLAQRRLWLTTPYLVPHTDLLTAMQMAALRGVDLRILVPLGRDHLLPWFASRDYFDDFERVGAQVLEYQPGFMHQKVALIDDDIAVIGTINLDIRSVLLNFEQAAIVHDTEFAARVEAMLRDDFAKSEQATTHLSLRCRLLAPAARLFGPLL